MRRGRHAALFDATEKQLPDFAELGPRAQEWESLTAEAFVAGYEEAARDCTTYPRDA